MGVGTAQVDPGRGFVFVVRSWGCFTRSLIDDVDIC